MAININATFPTSVPADANYTTGSIKDATAEGANDGTKIKAILQNDYQGFFQKLLAQAGVTANNAPDSLTNPQYWSALESLLGNPVFGIDNTNQITATDTTLGGGRTVAGVQTSQYDEVIPEGGAFWKNTGAVIPGSAGTGPVITGAGITIYDDIGVEYILSAGGKPVNVQAVGAQPGLVFAQDTDFDLLKGSGFEALIAGEYRLGSYDFSTFPAIHATVDALLSVQDLDSTDLKTDLKLYDDLTVLNRDTGETFICRANLPANDDFKTDVQTATLDYDTVTSFVMNTDITSDTLVEATLVLTGATNTVSDDAHQVQFLGLPTAGNRAVGRIDAIAVGDYYELGAHVSATNVGTDGSIYFAVHDGSDALWGVEITQKSATSNTFVNQVSLITGDGGTPTKTTIDVGDNNDRYSLEEPSTVTVGLHIVEVDTVAVYVNRRYFGSISSPGSVNTGSRYIIFAPNNNIQDGGGTGRATMYDFAKVEGLVTPDTPQTVNNPNLVIFGEDGTYGLENNTPWTTQLQKAAGKLTGLGDNLNISQDFSGPDEDVASQLTIAISSLAAVSPAPDVAIISLGHNDALLSTNRGTFRSDLEALIAQVNGDFPDAVVVLVLPWFTPNDTIQASLSDYALVTQTVAAENNAIIADAMTTASAFTFGDLNEAFPQGSAAIASAVAAGVYKALADQTLGPSPIKAPELLNSTYGHGSRTVMQGPARPTQGLFTAGDYFALTTPFSAGVNPDDYFVVGYFRVTTGSGNVLDTDWYSDRVYRLPRTN